MIHRLPYSGEISQQNEKLWGEPQSSLNSHLFYKTWNSAIFEIVPLWSLDEITQYIQKLYGRKIKVPGSGRSSLTLLENHLRYQTVLYGLNFDFRTIVKNRTYWSPIDCMNTNKLLFLAFLIHKLNNATCLQYLRTSLQLPCLFCLKCIT